MSRKKIIILAVILLAISIGGLVYDYTFNSKHRDIANEKASITLPAQELYTHFQYDEPSANSKFLDKVIEIQGKITSIEANEIVLNDQIQVSFDTLTVPKLNSGNSLTIKGRCVGYDELLEMVKIDQATVTKQQ